MNATTKVKSKDLAPNLTCHICKGYFIDATTIIECLHSFCKSCIVKHLEKSDYCPVCDVQLHSTKPLSSIRSDQMLQEVVYKLVPGLFQNEMQRRRKFYEGHKESKPQNQFDSGHTLHYYITSDDIINLTLEYQTTDKDFRESTKRFIKCPAAVSISILKKLIQGKYDLTNEARIEVMYGERILPDDFLLMDIAYKYSWTQNGKPLQLCYRIKGPSALFKSFIPCKPPAVKSETPKPFSIKTKDNVKIPSLSNSIKKKEKNLLKKRRQSCGTTTTTTTKTTTTTVALSSNGPSTPTSTKGVNTNIVNSSSSNSEKKIVVVTNGETPKLPKTKSSDHLISGIRRKSKNSDMKINGGNEIHNKIKTNKDPHRLNSKLQKLPIRSRDFATCTSTSTHLTTKIATTNITTTTTTPLINKNNNGEPKEKEVQLRISENGVICARNIVSGEEKIIHGAHNGPSSLVSSSSSSSTTCSTTIVTPSCIAAGSYPSMRPSNGIQPSNQYLIMPGLHNTTTNNYNNSSNSTNTHTDPNNFPILTNKSFNNNSHIPVVQLPISIHNTSSLSITNTSSPHLNSKINTANNNNNSNKGKFKQNTSNIKHGNNLAQTATITPTGPNKNLSLSRKRHLKNNIIVSNSNNNSSISSSNSSDAGKLDSKAATKLNSNSNKVPTKRKLLSSNNNSCSSNNISSTNMETLKSVNKRLREDFGNYPSAEIFPIINGSPSLITSSLLNQKAALVIPNNDEVNSKNSSSKRPSNNIINQGMPSTTTSATSFINGGSNGIDGKFTPPTNPTNFSSSCSSPSSNSKIFSSKVNSLTPSSNNNKSPSGSPKKPPKFFKSRHTIDANNTTPTTATTTTATTIGAMLANSNIVGGNSSSFSSNNYNNKNKAKMNEDTISSSYHNNGTPTTSTLPTFVSVHLNNSTNTTTATTAYAGSTSGAGTGSSPSTIRYPYTFDFSNGLPFNSVPLQQFTPQNCGSLPIFSQFQNNNNNPKSTNNNNIMFTNAFMNFLPGLNANNGGFSILHSSNINNNNGNNNSSNNNDNSNSNNNNSTNGNNTTLDLSAANNISSSKLASQQLPQNSHNNNNSGGNYSIIVPQQQQQQNSMESITASQNKPVNQYSSTNLADILRFTFPTSIQSNQKIIYGNPNEQLQHHHLQTSLSDKVDSGQLQKTESPLKSNENSSSNSNKQKTNASPCKTTDLSNTIPLQIANNLLVAQQQQQQPSTHPPVSTRGFHNLGLGVNFFISNSINSLNGKSNNAVTTKNSRKSSSPAKIGRPATTNGNATSPLIKTTTTTLLATPEKAILPKPAPIITVVVDKNPAVSTNEPSTNQHPPNQSTEKTCEASLSSVDVNEQAKSQCELPTTTTTTTEKEDREATVVEKTNENNPTAVNNNDTLPPSVTASINTSTPGTITMTPIASNSEPQVTIVSTTVVIDEVPTKSAAEEAANSSNNKVTIDSYMNNGNQDDEHSTATDITTTTNINVEEKEGELVIHLNTNNDSDQVEGSVESPNATLENSAQSTNVSVEPPPAPVVSTVSDGENALADNNKMSSIDKNVNNNNNNTDNNNLSSKDVNSNSNPDSNEDSTNNNNHTNINSSSVSEVLSQQVPETTT